MIDIEKSLVLLGEYGSVAQGTSGPNSDHDYMGIVVEPKSYVMGLDTYETKRKADAKDGEKSKPGESDTTYHSLRKFASLAAAGNPTIAGILFLPHYDKLNYVGATLVEERSLFASRRAGHAYHGYMTAQIKALEGVGKKQREELVNEHGYDVKFAYHAYRLGIQGYDYMTTGVVRVPMEGDSLAFAKAIRAGQVEQKRVMRELYVLRDELDVATKNSHLPEQPDYARINDMLVYLHERHWSNVN